MNKKDLILAEKYLEEQTFFKERLNLETGEVVEETYDPENSVIIEFNQEASENFSKVLQAILESRGVKNPEDIDANDADVKKIIEKRLKRKRGELKGREARRTTLSEQEISSVISGAIRSHKPHFNATMAQVIIYLLLVNDIFYEEKNGAIASRFEIEIPEDYWEEINRVIGNSGGSITDKVLGQSKEFVVASPYYDPENPLERMIAFVVNFLEKYPLVSETINEYLTRVMANLSLGGGVLRRLDNFQTFSELLDGLLHQNLGETSEDEQREDVKSRVGRTTKENESGDKPTTTKKKSDVNLPE